LSGRRAKDVRVSVGDVCLRDARIDLRESLCCPVIPIWGTHLPEKRVGMPNKVIINGSAGFPHI
jgi:hypothetical protein